MQRRDRDPRNAPQGPRGNPPPPRRAPAPQPAPRVASWDDPNAYRAPGFQELEQNPYRVDYAGLPADVEDGTVPQPPAAPAHGGSQGGFGRFSNPRGMGGRRPDRHGTDPNAYRSPGFRDELAKQRRPGEARGPGGPGGGGARRPRRDDRPRIETTCSACGAPAVVPFEPSAERPAFCKPCYQVKKVELDLGPGRRPAPRDDAREAPADATPAPDSPRDGEG